MQATTTKAGTKPHVAMPEGVASGPPQQHLGANIQAGKTQAPGFQPHEDEEEMAPPWASLQALQDATTKTRSNPRTTTLETTKHREGTIQVALKTSSLGTSWSTTTTQPHPHKKSTVKPFEAAE